MKKTLLALQVCAALVLTGCSGMNTTQQRTLSGGAIGAAAGTGIALLADGNPVWGLIGGAAVGALGGYLYDKHEANKQQ
jgi:uncharacterized membrane protein